MLKYSVMLFACLLTNDGLSCDQGWKFQFRVLDTWRCLMVGPYPLKPFPLSWLLVAHWKTDHLDKGMVIDPFVFPSSGNPYLVSMSLPQG